MNKTFTNHVGFTQKNGRLHQLCLFFNKHRITNTINIMCNIKNVFFVFVFISLANTDNSTALHCDNGMTMIGEEWNIEESKGRRSIFLQALNQSSGWQRAVRSSKLWMCDACSYTLEMFVGSRRKKINTVKHQWQFFFQIWGRVTSFAVCSVWKHQTIETVQTVDIKDRLLATLQNAKPQICV